MYSVRRLPPLLRVVWGVGLLLSLAGLGVLIDFFVTRTSPTPRMWTFVFNLTSLSLACTSVVNASSARVARPERVLFWLDTWQSQMRALLLLWALPLCGIVVALATPPPSPASWIAFPISLLAYFAAFGAVFATPTGLAGTRTMHAPPTT